MALSNNSQTEEDEEQTITVNDELKIEGLGELEKEYPQATEQEQKDFEKYQKEVEKQKETISSYEDLIAAKERNEKQKDIDRWLKRISEKCNQLRSQEYKDPDIRDRLGKRSDFYREVIDSMYFNRDSYLNGDLDKQHAFIKLLGSREADETHPTKIRQQLQDFK